MWVKLMPKPLTRETLAELLGELVYSATITESVGPEYFTGIHEDADITEELDAAAERINSYFLRTGQTISGGETRMAMDNKQTDDCMPSYSELVEGLSYIVDEDDLRRSGMPGDIKGAIKHARRLLTLVRRAQFPSLMERRQPP